MPTDPAIEAAAQAIMDVGPPFTFSWSSKGTSVSIDYDPVLDLARRMATAAIRAWLAAQPAEATVAELRETLP